MHAAATAAAQSTAITLRYLYEYVYSSMLYVSLCYAQNRTEFLKLDWLKQHEIVLLGHLNLKNLVEL